MNLLSASIYLSSIYLYDIIVCVCVCVICIIIITQDFLQ